MLKNASLPHGLRTQAKWRHTSVCARFSTAEESSKACSSPSARAIFTYTETLCPCNGTCSARTSRLPMFSWREGSEGNKHVRSFQ